MPSVSACRGRLFRICGIRRRTSSSWRRLCACRIEPHSLCRPQRTRCRSCERTGLVDRRCRRRRHNSSHSPDISAMRPSAPSSLQRAASRSGRRIDRTPRRKTHRLSHILQKPPCAGHPRPFPAGTWLRSAARQRRSGRTVSWRSAPVRVGRDWDSQVGQILRPRPIRRLETADSSLMPEYERLTITEGGSPQTMLDALPPGNTNREAEPRLGNRYVDGDRLQHFPRLL